MGEKAGMLLTLAGIILILLAAVAVIPELLLYPGIVMLLIGIPLVFYGGRDCGEQ